MKATSQWVEAQAGPLRLVHNWMLACSWLITEAVASARGECSEKLASISSESLGKSLVAWLFLTACLFLRFQLNVDSCATFQSLFALSFHHVQTWSWDWNCGFIACWLRPKGANLSQEIEARSDGLDNCCNVFIVFSAGIRVGTV